MTHKIYTNRHWVFLTLSVIHIAIFWPGFLSADSESIIAQALSGSFTDHHPPLYGYLWMYLMKVYPGGGLMFIVQAALIWGASYNLSCAVGKRWPIFICFLLPFYPGFITHSAFLWKDIHFTHGYIFIASLLIRQSVEGKKLNLWQLIGVLALLFYATSVKYQARFLAPLMSLWIIRHQFGSFLSLKALSLIAILSTINIFGTDYVNALIVPPTKQNHSWQCVKFFDLAGISVNLNRVIVPKLFLRTPETTIEDIKDHYDYLWEPLITTPTSPLRFTKSDEERSLLLETWKQQVVAHPWAYIKHRLRLWIKIVQQNSLRASVERAIEGTSIPGSVKWLTYVFSYIVWIPVLLFYIFFGLYTRRTSLTASSEQDTWLDGMSTVRISEALVLLCLISLTLPAFLFVFSLAATPRYVYFSQVFLAFAHPLFLILATNRWLSTRLT